MKSKCCHAEVIQKTFKRIPCQYSVPQTLHLCSKCYAHIDYSGVIMHKCILLHKRVFLCDDYEIILHSVKNKLMTVKEVAKEYGVDKLKIYSLISAYPKYGNDYPFQLVTQKQKHTIVKDTEVC